MELLINKKDDVTTVSLAGRLDTPAAQDISSNKMGPLMEAASGTIIMDCKELTYISSSGLRIVLAIRKEAAQKGGKVIVKSISDDIRHVFMMTGFLNLFQVED